VDTATLDVCNALEVAFQILDHHLVYIVLPTAYCDQVQQLVIAIKATIRGALQEPPSLAMFVQLVRTVMAAEDVVIVQPTPTQVLDLVRALAMPDFLHLEVAALLCIARHVV
jgi:hypothetical protein